MKTILIVDDELDILSALELIFTIERYRVLTASNGLTALNLLSHSRPDVILTDWMMPEMDGVTFCRAVRSDPALSDIPIIVSSAAPAAPLGAAYWNRFLSKPVEIADLLALVHEFTPE
jgi:CheY-like chemotaxis protein